MTIRTLAVLAFAALLGIGAVTVKAHAYTNCNTSCFGNSCTTTCY